MGNKPTSVTYFERTFRDSIRDFRNAMAREIFPGHKILIPCGSQSDLLKISKSAKIQEYKDGLATLRVVHSKAQKKHKKQGRDSFWGTIGMTLMMMVYYWWVIVIIFFVIWGFVHYN